MSKALEDLLKKESFSDKLIERLSLSAGNKITSDSQFWIHRYINEMNLKLCPWGCAIKNSKELERYQKQVIIFVQNCEIKETLEQIDMNKEFLVLFPKETGEGQKKHYVMVYVPSSCEWEWKTLE